MRLTVCALSAVLLSGCSWLGMGGSPSNSYGYSNNGSYGCAAGGAGQYGQPAYGAGGCGGAGGYNVSGNGYGTGYGAGASGYGAGATGYGMGVGGYNAGANSYGMGAGSYGAGATGYGIAGAYGAGANTGYGYGTGANSLRGVQGGGMYGVGAGGGYGASTMLGGAAPYGSAVAGGTQYASTGGQYINGQWVTSGATSVQTIQGAPIYVPQPYPAYYGVGYNAGFTGGLRGGSAAMPFGLEASIGREFHNSGNIFGGADAKPAGTNNISKLDPIGYKDAYDDAQTYGLAATYDMNPNTTLLGSVGYSKAEGQRLKVGTIDDGGAVSEDLYAQWGDIEEYTVEGGVRKYLGGWNNALTGIRPYVQGTAGFSHNNSINLVQDSATLAPAALNTQEYISEGWTPTASGLIGAEMQVGPRTAIGIEGGVRWRDKLDTNLPSEARWSIPVKLRGRVSF